MTERSNALIYFESVCSVLLVFVAVLFQTPCIAFETGPRVEGEMEATVINVDAYGVYVPNVVFYWDTEMKKEQIAGLTSSAKTLRNKKALIRYSAIGDLKKDKRPLLVDIAPYKEEPRHEANGFSGTTFSNQPRETVDEEKEQVTKQEEGWRDEPRESKVRYGAQERPQAPDSSTPITKGEIVDFIERCVRATESRNLDASLACYADQVDYYSKGKVEKQFIKWDKSLYFRNWARIDSRVGNIVLIVTDQNDVRIAKFTSYYTVANASRTLSGEAENVWKIQRINNELKIVDEKQKIVARMPE